MEQKQRSVENLGGMNNCMDIFDSFYRGKRVLVTGHTGFKGSWLAVWLHEIGAEVIGVGLDPATERANFELTGIGGKIAADIRADIRDGERLKHIFKEYKPEIVFHLAAQPLVRLSYQCPVETYQTNVMGTINVLEAIRATGSVKIGVMITTDKCYENREQIWGYRENEAMGGYDPYSSSKGAAEIAIACISPTIAIRNLFILVLYLAVIIIPYPGAIAPRWLRAPQPSRIPPPRRHR